MTLGQLASKTLMTDFVHLKKKVQRDKKTMGDRIMTKYECEKGQQRQRLPSANGTLWTIRQRRDEQNRSLTF
jgi:hypothetical protein